MGVEIRRKWSKFCIFNTKINRRAIWLKKVSFKTVAGLALVCPFGHLEIQILEGEFDEKERVWTGGLDCLKWNFSRGKACGAIAKMRENIFRQPQGSSNF